MHCLPVDRGTEKMHSAQPAWHVCSRRHHAGHMTGGNARNTNRAKFLTKFPIAYARVFGAAFFCIRNSLLFKWLIWKKWELVSYVAKIFVSSYVIGLLT